MAYHTFKALDGLLKDDDFRICQIVGCHFASHFLKWRCIMQMGQGGNVWYNDCWVLKIIVGEGQLWNTAEKAFTGHTLINTLRLVIDSYYIVYSLHNSYSKPTDFILVFVLGRKTGKNIYLINKNRPEVSSSLWFTFPLFLLQSTVTLLIINILHFDICNCPLLITTSKTIAYLQNQTGRAITSYLIIF